MSEKSTNDQKKPATKAKKIYNIVSTAVVLVVFVLLVALIGVVMYQRKHGGDAKLFGYYMFNVISDSMEPTINVGDVILAKEVSDVNALKEGDVITFVAPSGRFKGYNITHRIYSVKKGDDGAVRYFETKGDNPNVQVDDWHLSPSAVKAVFVRVSPFISGFKDFISHWYGYVVLIVIPLVLVGVLVVIGYVRDRVAEAKEAQAAAPVSASDLTDEQKRKLLEDYLAQSADGAEQSNGAQASQDAQEVNAEQGTANEPSRRSDDKAQKRDDDN